MSIRFASKKKLAQLREMAELFAAWRKALGTDEQYLLRELNVELPRKGEFEFWGQEFETIYVDKTLDIFTVLYKSSNPQADKIFELYKEQYYDYMIAKQVPAKSQQDIEIDELKERMAAVESKINFEFQF